MSSSDVELQKSDPGVIRKTNEHLNGVMATSNINTSSVDPQHPPAAAAMSKTRETFFLIFITLSNLVQIMPLGLGVGTALAIGEDLGAGMGESSWIAASYPLTQGTFVLIGGRLGAIFGHKNLFTVGCVIWTVFCFAGGYSNDLVAMCVFRALAGIGGGLILPNVVALLGITFPPGMKRNMSFALFGAMAPVGAGGGVLVGGVIVQLVVWKWAFFLLGLLGFIVFGVAITTIEHDAPQDPNGDIDYVGSYLGVAAMILFNFVWNQAPAAGWSSAYIITLLVVSVVHFAAFAYWEAKVASSPILPFTIWKAPSFGILVIAIFLSFMSIGVFFWYIDVYMQTIRRDSLVQIGVQFLPLTIGGFFVAFLSGLLISKIPNQFIIAIGCVAVIIMQALLATVPAHITYWAYCFPAMLASAFTIDMIVTASQIIASNNVAIEHQGIAGSLIGTLMGYGLSTGIGLAGTVQVHTDAGGKNLLHGYHMAAFLGLALAGVALVLSVFFVRIPKDVRQGWDETEAK